MLQQPADCDTTGLDGVSWLHYTPVVYLTTRKRQRVFE